MANTYPVKILTDFERFLKNLLRDVFDSSRIKFQKSGNQYSISPSSARKNNNEFIVPFFKKNEDEIIWLGVTISFASIQIKSEPEEISLRFFSGNGENFTMIFRAEFSKAEENHNQPHWHFNIYEKPVDEGAYDEEAIHSFEESFLSNIKSMHFCMAWNLKSGGNLDLTQNIQKWMEYTVQNIKDELVYAYR